MDQNTPSNWPPTRQHVRSTSVSSSKSVSTLISTPLHGSTGTFNSPGNPLAPDQSQKQYRSGYEVKPKALAFKPYALNNPGTVITPNSSLGQESELFYVFCYTWNNVFQGPNRTDFIPMHLFKAE
jgi:hypothetical protein